MTSSSTSVISVSSVSELVKKEVPDWDDEVLATARFKAFSGQRSDWEPRFLFWRDLILKVARNLGVCVVRVSELKNTWFSRGALTPLCMDQVVHEMHANGDILLREELTNPTSGRLFRLLKLAGQILGTFRSSSLEGHGDNTLILRILLQEKAANVIKTLGASNWTSTCVITMKSFQNLCKDPDETYALLSYLCESRQACYLSVRKEVIEGVKLSLASTSSIAVSDFDYDLLHLIWTTENLQQQVDTVNQRWENSRKMALASLRSGNKQAAYRHIRQAKLFSENKAKCVSFLERVEEVLAVIAEADSTRKVSEAMQIGARVIKGNMISVEELNVQLQELDGFITDQKQINEVIESMPLQSVDFADEDVEEEFMKLEMELVDEMPQTHIPKPAAPQQAIVEESHDTLSQNLSKLNLEAA
ncbi:charged multivesicular body protein 7 [Phalaenopsis equestris]|uniref:charged multivesicular body protein 7 n=1 Tax=Phalaenopsis equestris TaxID=78828 RepID=UPI0009E19769|nr:charged multivesicular body protein 7 [Phalaenopsis equestris]